LLQEVGSRVREKLSNQVTWDQLTHQLKALEKEQSHYNWGHLSDKPYLELIIFRINVEALFLYTMQYAKICVILD
jgi:hypothetical protein